MTETSIQPALQVVKLQRNKHFRSVSDGEILDDAERGFPPSITDSSLYESIQSIEARCMRGELVLDNNYHYEYDGDISEDDLDGTPEQNLDEGELDENIDVRAEIRFSDLSTGNEPESDKTEKSEPATLPVDKSGEAEIAAGD